MKVLEGLGTFAFGCAFMGFGAFYCLFEAIFKR